MKTLPAGVQRGFMKDTLHSTTTSIRPYSGLGSDLGGTKGRCLFAGSWNADIYPSLKAHVKPEDLHCAKNRMSGLVSTTSSLISQDFSSTYSLYSQYFSTQDLSLRVLLELPSLASY